MKGVLEALSPPIMKEMRSCIILNRFTHSYKFVRTYFNSSKVFRARLSAFLESFQLPLQVWNARENQDTNRFAKVDDTCLEALKP